jgi:hypothetical protein
LLSLNPFVFQLYKRIMSDPIETPAAPVPATTEAGDAKVSRAAINCVPVDGCVAISNPLLTFFVSLFYLIFSGSSQQAITF